ncbi:unnamed protein product [Arctia plantaginis]|uniref:Sodium-dependent dopamine transporter n=1 Tax=Arctia plantaginis TaxID=874455 RepID=A0A8S0Z2H1_ARCPL|nr:unnamed protein product [Arctia plantaginis]
MTSNILVTYSSSLISGSKVDWNTDTHFRWQSIKKFICIATTMSSTVFNFDLFSKVTTKVRIYDFFILESTVGISYLFMDSFTKLYTKRYDCSRFLNPLLRGISYGQLVQTGYFSLIHGSFMADTMRYLAGVFREVPLWATCTSDVNITCVSMKEVVIQCARNRTTSFQHTSVFFYYKNYFTYSGDRNTVSSRLFVTAIAWILVFLLSSVTDETIVKIFNLTNLFTTFTTIITIVFLLYSKNSETAAAFLDIFDETAESSWTMSMQHVAYSYGIGFLGIYDYGTISPFVMVDTALLPSTTEFFYVKKLFLLFILGNLAVTLMSFETFLISTISKFLQYEFKQVKQVYIVGMVCAAGFGITVTFIGISIMYGRRQQLAAGEGGIIGLDILVLYLSAFRVAIIMWLYGVKKFATDINFWLGFYPAKFWSYSWGLLPFMLTAFLINKVSLLVLPLTTQIKDVIYILLTFIFVSIFQIKTVAAHLIRNNIIGAFRSSRLYGPPDSDDRKRRQSYDEVNRQNKCKHNCMVIDEWFDCNHDLLPLSEKTSTLEAFQERSLRNIYHSE